MWRAQLTRTGLEIDKKGLITGPAPSREHVADRLMSKSRQLEVAMPKETYPHGGRFNQDAMPLHVVGTDQCSAPQPGHLSFGASPSRGLNLSV
jgi:hypothetical protein